MMESVSPDPAALHARLRPDSLACVDFASGERWSYRAFDADIQSAVAFLQSEGVGKGDRVAALARNSARQVILQQALMRIGAVFAPLNWRLSAPELAQILADCAPVLLYADQPTPALPPGCRSASMAALAEGIRAHEPAPRPPPHAGDAPCVILYTSGTSGTPKGALLTSGFLLSTGVNFGVLGEVDSGCVFLCDSPMFHVIGIVTQIWPPLLRGGAILISSGFDPIATNDRLGDAALGVTHYFCVPQMAEALRHAENFAPERWSRLKALFTGGAPNPPAHIRWWLDQGVRMVDGYGMTETGTTLGMSLTPEMIRAKAGSVGLPGPLTRVRIVDLEDRDVPVGVSGEILVRGPNVIPGYWNRPEERERSFTPDGWLRTGDIGRQDEDGYIAIVDRRKDMFISGGENVYPVEIEALLVEHPAVREAAVIGVPDEKWGEVGRAFIVAAPGADLTAEALAAYCQDRIARYKIPKSFEIVKALPRTGSGKVMKHVLRREAGGSSAAL